MSKVTTDKKEAILNKALELFIERGFHNTPTSLIAKEAGVATGTLFHHFTNKEILFNELYLSVKSKMVEGMKIHLESDVPLQEKIKYLWKYAVNWMVMHPKEFQFFQEFGHSPIISKITHEKAMNLFGNYTKLLEEICNSGMLKNVYPELVADYFKGVMFHSVLHFRTYPEKISEENIDLCFEIMWSGLAK